MIVESKLGISEDDLVGLALEQYGRPICTDMLDEAMKAETVQEAIDILITDSAYWDNVSYGINPIK